jgi:hypothetical protein
MRGLTTKAEMEKSCADMIGPASGWWVTRGTETTLQSEPDPEADGNAPRYSFATLLNWLNINRVLTTGHKVSDGWIVTIKQSGKNFYAQSKADAIGEVVKYVLSDVAHLWESKAA